MFVIPTLGHFFLRTQGFLVNFILGTVSATEILSQNKKCTCATLPWLNVIRRWKKKVWNGYFLIVFQEITDQKKLRIWILFTQCSSAKNQVQVDCAKLMQVTSPYNSTGKLLLFPETLVCFGKLPVTFYGKSMVILIW